MGHGLPVAKAKSVGIADSEIKRINESEDDPRPVLLALINSTEDQKAPAPSQLVPSLAPSPRARRFHSQQPCEGALLMGVHQHEGDVFNYA